MNPAPLSSMKENVMVLGGPTQQRVSTFYCTWNNISHPQKTTLLVMRAVSHVALLFFFIPSFSREKLNPAQNFQLQQRIILLSKNSHLKIINEQSQHSKQEIRTSFQLKINAFCFLGGFLEVNFQGNAKGHALEKPQIEMRRQVPHTPHGQR